MSSSDLEAAISLASLTMTSVFVPWSQSRNKHEKHRSFNWRVTLLKDGKPILETDYSAGFLHSPSLRKYQLARLTNDQQAHVQAETEYGFRYRDTGPYLFKITPKVPILPDIKDVVASLMMDASVLDYNTYEDWAPDTGYDPDSRKGEAIYRQCLDHALRLRNGLGDTDFRRLQEAAHGY